MNIHLRKFSNIIIGRAGFIGSHVVRLFVNKYQDFPLATTIVAALKNPVEGIYHYSNEGVCSWFDFTKMIAEYAGNTECDIQPCHSDEFPSPVKRPAYSVLDKTKVKQTFGIKIPYWTDSLKICINNIKKA